MITLACNFAAGKLHVQHVVLRTTSNVNYLASYCLRQLSFHIFWNTAVGDSSLLPNQHPFQKRGKPRRHKAREIMKLRKENEGETKFWVFFLHNNFEWWINLEFWQPWISFSLRILHDKLPIPCCICCFSFHTASF